MNDLTVSMPSAPAPLDPRFAPESPGVSSPAIIPSPFALAIVPFLLANRIGTDLSNDVTVMHDDRKLAVTRKKD